ncbi:hypothetical protein I4U23_031535 [Adineta vaga]|nr:hypothetical protein I4U23_031535 [Adineta vaga]
MEQLSRSIEQSITSDNNKNQYKDIFAREASIVNPSAREKKLFISDKCEFDVIKTSKGHEAVNIQVVERNIKSVSQLPKIPKKNKKPVNNKLKYPRRANSHNIERQNDEYKEEENKRRASALKFAQKDDEFKTEENKRRAGSHKTERQNDEFKKVDNKRRAEALKITREDEEFKEEERK